MMINRASCNRLLHHNACQASLCNLALQFTWAVEGLVAEGLVAEGLAGVGLGEGCTSQDKGEVDA